MAIDEEYGEQEGGSVLAPLHPFTAGHDPNPAGLDDLRAVYLDGLEPQPSQGVLHHIELHDV